MTTMSHCCCNKMAVLATMWRQGHILQTLTTVIPYPLTHGSVTSDTVGFVILANEYTNLATVMLIIVSFCLSLTLMNEKSIS